MKRGRPISIGMVIDAAVKPCRDVMLGIMNSIQDRQSVVHRSFLASVATSPGNIAAFAESGVAGIVICGVRREVVMEFLRSRQRHPPLVLCTYAPLSASERTLLGTGGTVMLDNAAIGVQAANFFLGHGLQNFAFVASNIYHERMTGDIRCAAFESRLKTILGSHMTFARLNTGVYMDNGDFWELDSRPEEKMLASLPAPCGILVNGDRRAFDILTMCQRLGISIPGQMEVLGVDNAHGLCEESRPTLSSISPDYVLCGKKAVEMLLALIADPLLPMGQRDVLVGVDDLVERGSTASVRDFGHIASRVREYVRVNACSGIGVEDVVKHLGVSRRTIEKRVREATGQSVLSMIQKVRLENVCHLLTTTNLPISAVTMNSGYELTSNLGKLFQRSFGMSMSTYRIKYSHVG